MCLIITLHVCLFVPSAVPQGDSPETWRTDEFRMFEGGSLWKPPPLKNLLSKVLPPIQEVVKKGQLSAKLAHTFSLNIPVMHCF